MVCGAGERPAKSSLTSPVYVLPDCAPLWRAFAHLAYKYSKKVHAVSRYAGEHPRACHAVTGQSYCGGIVSLVAAYVNHFPWT